MHKRRRKLRTGLILSLAALVTVIWSGKKVVEFSQEPQGDKDCDFIYYRESDGTKVTQIEVKYEGEVINDASCLNQTPIYGVVTVKSEEDIRNALAFARENDLKISLAGQQHSMGGQTFTRGGLVLDMKEYKELSLDKEAKLLTAEAGATWADIQELLDGEGLSVKAMQSINIFTVGGTLSVNAHGIAHDPGQVGFSVKNARVLLPSGEIVNCGPTENTELFSKILGGYGLFGIILDAELELVENAELSHEREYMDYKDFPNWYAKNIEENEEVNLFYARLSMSPFSYLEETAAHSFKTLPGEAPEALVTEKAYTGFMRFIINFSKTGGVGRWLRWTLEKNLEPVLNCSRNNAMSQADEVCRTTRNQSMYDSMQYLKNKLPDTDILQEYFVEPEHFVEFVDGLRKIVKKNDANLLNVTIRIVHADALSTLAYAPTDRFALVLYFNQKLNVEESAVVEKTTVELIDLTESLGGSFYLPYQLYYSKEQLRAAYPEIDDFFAKKLLSDPEEILSNKWYEKYSK
ncbi:MAG: FAD-binding oxidoreductase [Patescibacteria group bacterium]